MSSLYVDCNTGETFCQSQIELKDGRRDWRGKKAMTLRTAHLMEEYDPERAAKLRECGTYLEFAKAPDGMKLHRANFCRERMCPMCQWRRCAKLRVQADKIYKAEVEAGYQHIFVTLTQRNCTGEQLCETLDKMSVQLRRWQRSADYGKSFAGAYCATEVTYNAERNDFHPHFHLILTCQKDYFDPHNPNYWTLDRIIDKWAELMELDYRPSCEVEAVKQKPGYGITSSLAELCKYPTKVAQVPDSKTLEIVDRALRGRKLIRWTGITAKIREQMNMDDIEQGNLIHTDEAVADGVGLEKVVYIWRYGFYVPMGMEKV